MNPDDPTIAPEDNFHSYDNQPTHVESFAMSTDFAEAHPSVQDPVDSIWADTPGDVSANPSGYPEGHYLAEHPAQDLAPASPIEPVLDVSVANNRAASAELPAEESDYPEGHFLAEQAGARGHEDSRAVESPADVTVADGNTASAAVPSVESEYPEGHFLAEQAAARGHEHSGPTEPSAEAPETAANPTAEEISPTESEDAKAHFADESAAARHSHRHDAGEPTPDVSARGSESASIEISVEESDYPEGHAFAKQSTAHGHDAVRHSAPTEDRNVPDADANVPGSYERDMAEFNDLCQESHARGIEQGSPVGPDDSNPGSLTYEEALARIDFLERALHPSSGNTADGTPNPRESSMEEESDHRFETTSSRSHAHDSSRENHEPRPDETPGEEDHASFNGEEEPVVYQAPLAPLSSAELADLLKEKAASAGEPLAWKTSVVDLLKLFGQDSSREARGRLAVELGLPGAEHADVGSAKFNESLHRHLLSSLARSGGHWPSDGS